MGAIVEIRGLSKVYHRRRGKDVVAVEDLDLELASPGRVHGFLGPNGSGKTTTIRCLLGLIQPTGGEVSVFGANSASAYHRVAARVGAIVENPKMFPNFSAGKNLSLLARLGGIGRDEVERVLRLVGLQDRAGDSFASYSLGMKQRLAIAAALLKDPDLLILDEPANGLDPAGIAEMRRLIAGIADQGKAVVVSSHQLAEMEQVCDDVTIINRGRLVETGTLAHMKSFAGEDKVVATIDDRNEALVILTEAGIPCGPRPAPNELRVDIPVERSSDVTRILAERGHYLSGLRTESATLEAAFLNLTGEPMSLAPPPPPPPGSAQAQPGSAQPPPPGSVQPPPGSGRPPEHPPAPPRQGPPAKPTPGGDAR